MIYRLDLYLCQDSEHAALPMALRPRALVAGAHPDDLRVPISGREDESCELSYLAK